jgi:hypothetical protein
MAGGRVRSKDRVKFTARARARARARLGLGLWLEQVLELLLCLG